MASILKFDDFVVWEMAGSAFPLLAILAKIVQILCWVGNNNFFYKMPIYLHNYISNLYLFSLSG